MSLFDDDKPALSINDRIVWFSDNGPEFGNVRWLGKLPDLGQEWMAGVEFDNPVGSGTGLYKERQLFETELNHASLVPIIGLIKESDFLEPSDKSHSGNHKSNQNHGKNFSDDSNFSNYPPDYSKHKYNYDILTESNQKSQIYLDSRNHKIRNVSSVTTESNHPIFNGSKSSRQIDNSDAPPQTERSGRFLNNLYPTLGELTNSLRKTKLNDHKNQQRTNNHVDSSMKSIPRIIEPSFVVNPHDINSLERLKNFLGKSKGIQGHNNSCYLDATLFSMFASTTLFDSLLHRPRTIHDIPEYEEVQRILREDIVNPLRKDQFVSADRVMKFRTMLERSSTVDGLTDQEKDPEEFLTLLLGQILKAEPYLKLSSGLESFFYQLIVDKDENVILPTVQDLCEQSFINSTVRLRDIPPCLLLQMPRFGRQYKMYPRIMPSLKLDITDILESAPRACGLRMKDCDNLAKYECKACYSEQSGRHNTRLSSVTYCANCFQAKHFGKRHSTGIEDHNDSKTLLDKTPKEAVARYSNRLSHGYAKDKEIPRIYMDLFAVLCIETSHYVCFVKCGDDKDSPWCFFDSMADRRGEQNGYNIPEVVQFEDFAFWTSEKGVACLLNNRDDKLLPEMAKRLICDAYLCFYRYTV